MCILRLVCHLDRLFVLHHFPDKVQHPNSVAIVSPLPLPFWYEYLHNTHKYSDAWLDGLCWNYILME